MPEEERHNSLNSDTRALMAQMNMKTRSTAYILLVLFGFIGIHRFYLDRTGSAIAMLILSITIIGLIITIPWAIIDLFLVPTLVDKENDKINRRFTGKPLI